MSPTRRSARGITVTALAAALAAGTAAPAAAAPPSDAERVGVIVQQLPGAGDAPERAVAAAGGTVVRQLGIIDAFSASVPEDRLAALRAVPGVREVTEDATVRLTSAEVTDQISQSGSLDWITESTGATAMWQKGYTGKGVDVAVIDSGVVPVEGLDTAGKLVYGPDLSLEAQQCDSSGQNCVSGPAYALDGYGHGTAMAGIIAGRDTAAPGTVNAASGDVDFLGMAPDARVVSVKVADSAGQSDVSQVIAGIDWVVANRRANGLDIRVLNLAFGTDGVQDYTLDPLAHAAEAAWRAGIVVVVSAGNRGSADEKLTNPAYDPYVLAVGAVDDRGTFAMSDDVIPEWSSKGDGIRNPDVVAPGSRVVGLRSPGSLLDTGFPEGRVGTRFFRGSGTSQAAAVVSGGVALMLQQRPTLTPDQVKALLLDTARRIPSADAQGQGRGLIGLAAAMRKQPPKQAAQTWPRSTGSGSLEASRGTAHVSVGGAELTGERDVFGTAWSGHVWATSSAAGTAFTDGSWSGDRFTGGSWLKRPWFGHGWNADHFAGQTWDGTAWVAVPWLPDADGRFSARTWAGEEWSARTWAARTWAGDEWSARTWAARTWAGEEWSARTWAASTWATRTWAASSWA
ncbi:serine protease AprX [Geodermatophilus pulveris]|uniref:Serine protease AprX n=1 Tax=Geodermatophilus pulveris TaxID=1564159 RepID=A0A239JDP7_9ACTN|nr:S8 family serine peptidase [Geodermatophilus pulveris]SNT03403.1 serine protease AprX [Geodermatophilus pulveris]